MAQIKVFYEPEMQLMTIFWQKPSIEQICTELGDGIILIKNNKTGEPIGIELLSYQPDDQRFDSVLVEIGQVNKQEELTV